MFQKFLFNKKLFNNKGIYYILTNFLIVIIFAILYYIQDFFITKNIEFSKQVGILDKNYNENNNENSEIKSLLYYFWFSLVTQTTVGYGTIINSNGKQIPFIKIEYIPFKILNILQLISIFVIAAIFIF